MDHWTRMLERRLRVFLDAGLLTRLPTRWQTLQAELEMAPYVLSADATAERAYRGAPLGHPIVRQPFILSQVGLDHLRVGTGLGARHRSLATHLAFTHHQGMPVFDLQVLQTHERGLERLQAYLEELLAGETPRARRHNRMIAWILPRAADYHRRFLGDEGWIARAARLDYPDPRDEGSRFPPEFFSLVGLLDYAARRFPPEPDPASLLRLPARLARRFRAA